MMKVYDMVTYGMYAPDENALSHAYEPCQDARPSAAPTPALQSLQLTHAPGTSTLPPSLRAVDIDRFIDACGD